jgi:uncharacterized integral membrane protein
MKKATLIIWAIIFGFIALVIFQNQTFFMTNHSLRLNLGVINEYHTPELPIAVVFIFFFLAGIVIAYLFNFSSRFKAKRTVKKLNAAIGSHEDEVSGLKRELNTLKGLETATEAQAAETKTGTDAIIELTGDSLVKNPADRPGKSSIDKQEANATKDSKDKSSKKKSN